MHFIYKSILFLVVGCKISVDSRLAFGANKKIIEAEVARKKQEYMQNEELAYIFELYKSMQVKLIQVYDYLTK
jgi:hypothetical protein